MLFFCLNFFEITQGIILIDIINKIVILSLSKDLPEIHQAQSSVVTLNFRPAGRTGVSGSFS